VQISRGESAVKNRVLVWQFLFSPPSRQIKLSA